MDQPPVAGQDYILLDEYSERPREPRKEMPKLDFSEFHGLFHWIGTPDCWRSYGGPIRHIQLWWQYQRPGWDRKVDWEHPVEPKFMHIDRSSVPEMGDEEVSEYEQVINAALKNGEGTLFVRGEDGKLKEQK